MNDRDKITFNDLVDENLFVDNKFSDSNSLVFSLNTNKEQKELDVISTDNIKEIKDNNISVNKNNIIVAIAKHGPNGNIGLSFLRLDIIANGNAINDAINIVTILNLIPKTTAI